MPTTRKPNRRPLTSSERVRQLANQQPKSDPAPVSPMALNDANAADDPTPSAIEHDRGVQDRYGWQP